MNPSASFAPDAPWRIDRNRLATLAARPAHDWDIEIVDETGSTNADLIERLRALPRDNTPGDPPAPIVRVAYSQTAGRGRRGRAWLGEPGNALLMSVGYVLRRPIEALSGLSLATGVAVLDALARLPLSPSARPALKWPNDVLLDDGKLAGILIETAWSAPGATAVVIGIGINLHGAEQLSAQVDDANRQAASAVPGATPATLARAWPDANLTDTLAALLNALDAALPRFETEGFKPFRQRWTDAHAYAGREVVLIDQGQEITRGVASGVDDSGQLMIDAPEGPRTVATGEPSLRLAKERP
ncbi:MULTISPECIES: biotin--[acetyl-CoA-carboxylase] ligase [unclassified Caballeronia]|uniref:biotin--[acetyl-CoA-carboxylase] ligase n=1 Tax=unclassified Caballeronia TaxID=2646786 RepID=UPI002863040F|nr:MULTISPECIES: biotin--[acetyl-CoA-carboxylase] ligase [unclassified Caballeronia]MDR5736870.1 biotin--[acetyl-CoA-carboxylase] ligase [Caballeronia sp. LZ016]MDR5810598.1 biotin--[acetyl-CoA-carboxylase] ligase [Caballeronia sp. LZ019]